VLPAYAVLFDLDGTLLDSTGVYFEITRRACRELGWPAPGPELLRDVMTRRLHPVEALFGPVDDLAARQEALSAAALQLWRPVFTELARPFPDAIPVLRMLHEAGMRLGIVTDSNDFVVSHLTDAPGCPPIDVVVTRERAGARKPSPAGVALALEELGIAPEAALYIGDNPCDIEAGRAAGVRTLGITTGAALREDLEPCGALAILDGLAGLPGLLSTGAPVVRGTLARGLGKAGEFLALDWVSAQVRAHLGSDFHPGTVNLRVSEAAGRLLARHRQDETLAHAEIRPAPGFCRALCHAVELAWNGSRVPALTLWPEVDGYPDTQLELICAPHLRSRWGIEDGAALTVHLARRAD
jgi:HAD superfamily hydrolase (TIGR01509 family)